MPLKQLFLNHRTFVSSTALCAALLLGVWTRANYDSSNSSAKGLFHFGTQSDYVCHNQLYTTEIISVDPLVIYINDFVSKEEAKDIIAVGEPELKSSEITRPGSHSSSRSQDRTSQSAALPFSSLPISCLVSRAASFMGPSLLHPPPPGLEAFSTPQLVRYKPGQYFDEHHDWFEHPQPVLRHRGMFHNRHTSFFIYLDDDDTREGGETLFPLLEIPGYAEDTSWQNGVAGEKMDKGVEKWRKHKDGGIAFVPRRGSAVFWVNLHRNGTGDRRVVHAGMELGKGIKNAMNLWGRVYYY